MLFNRKPRNYMERMYKKIYELREAKEKYKDYKPLDLSFFQGMRECPTSYGWWVGRGADWRFGRRSVYLSSYLDDPHQSDLGFINKLGEYCDMLRMDLLGKFNSKGTEYYDIRLSEFLRYAEMWLVSIEPALDSIDLRCKGFPVFGDTCPSKVPMIRVTYGVGSMEKVLLFYPGHIWWDARALPGWGNHTVTDIILRMTRKKKPSIEANFALFRYWTPVLIGVYGEDSYMNLSCGAIIKWDTWESHMYSELFSTIYDDELCCEESDAEPAGWWEICHEFDDMTDEERWENGWLPSDYNETC